MNENTFEYPNERKIHLDIDDSISSIHIEGDYYYDVSGLKGIIEDIHDDFMVININPTPNEYTRITEKRNQSILKILKFTPKNEFFLIPFLKNFGKNIFSLKEDNKRLHIKNRRIQLEYMSNVENSYKLTHRIEKLEEEIEVLKEKNIHISKNLSREIIKYKNKITELEHKLKNKTFDKTEKREITKRKKLERKMKIVMDNF